MKLFLKSTKEAIKDIMTPVVTVEEIHEAFDTASDHALELARTILDEEVTAEAEELKQLEALGFKSEQNVKTIKEQTTKRERSLKDIQLIQHYAATYPGYKFILSDDLNPLLKKYNLLLGQVKDFIGNIPATNRKEIIAFKSLEEPTVEYGHYSNFSYRTTYLLSPKRFNDFSAFERQQLMDGKEFRATVGGETVPVRLRNQFMIVAPANMFDLSDKAVDENNHIQKVTPPDPIVLYQVAGGYLIISKWGIESTLEGF